LIRRAKPAKAAGGHRAAPSGRPGSAPAQSGGRRLKVFQAQIGFYDTVVAASSQAAALRAWGTHQNLFASGDARVTADEAAIAAAVAHPNEPLRRPVGSLQPFSLEPEGLPEVPDAPRKPKPKPAGKTKPKPPPAADRTALTAAEAALRTLDDDRTLEEAAVRREDGALQARRDAAQASYVRARRKAHASVSVARERYRKAGGTD
jgi:hypothetical protein